jgi:hypothetical protein
MCLFVLATEQKPCIFHDKPRHRQFRSQITLQCILIVTAIKIRILKNGRNSIVNISKTKPRRYICLCIFGKSMSKLTKSRIFIKENLICSHTLNGTDS